MSFVYHIFSDAPVVMRDSERYPIIHSIDTLRAFTDEPIFVIDKTPHLHNWEHYPDLLNFEVIQDNRPTGFDLMTGKVIDIQRHLDRFGEQVIYVDSDIFWLQEPTPKKNDKFNTTFSKEPHYIRSNSGYYHFCRNSQGEEFFNNWIGFIKEANTLYSTIKLSLKYYYGNDRVTDETILTYAINYFNLANLVQQEEVGLLSRKTKTLESRAGVHVLSDYTKQKRKFAFDMREIRQVLGVDSDAHHFSLADVVKWRLWNEEHTIL